MTPKQRAAIYRKAAKWIQEYVDENGFYDSGICIAITYGVDEISMYDVFHPYLELKLFKQPSVYWWDVGDYESRIIALLLAAEIAEQGMWMEEGTNK